MFSCNLQSSFNSMGICSCFARSPSLSFRSPPFPIVLFWPRLTVAVQCGIFFHANAFTVFQCYSKSTKYLKRTFQTWSNWTVSLSQKFIRFEAVLCPLSVCGTHQWCATVLASLKTCGNRQRVVTFWISVSRICWFYSAVVLETNICSISLWPSEQFSHSVHIWFCTGPPNWLATLQ